MIYREPIPDYGFLFAADLHIGNHLQFAHEFMPGVNSRCAETVKAYSEFSKYAVKWDYKLVTVGDLYDSDKPTPSIYKYVDKNTSVISRPIMIKGNHESTSSFSEHHSLGVMPPGDVVDSRVRVFSLTTVDLWAIPFQTGPAKKWLPEQLKKLKDNVNEDKTTVMAIHLGIQDDSTPKHMQNHNDSITVGQLKKLAAEYKIDKVIAGNWHEHMEWYVKLPKVNRHLHIVQLGALTPTGFNNPGLHNYGGMYFINTTGDCGWVELPNIRFVKVNGVKNIPKALGHYSENCYVQVTVHPTHYNESIKICQDMKESGYIKDFKIVTNKKAMESRSRKVASATKSAKNLNEAIDTYVKKIAVNKGVSKTKIKNKIKQYIKV